MDLSNSLRDKGLNVLAEAVEVNGDKWGNEWIKNNTGLKSIDIANISSEDLEKLQNAEKIKTRELLNIIKDDGKTKEESRLRRAVRATLAFLVVGFTLFLFDKIIFPNQPNSIEQNKEIVMYILGALSTIVAQIFGFYFGTSESVSKTS